MKQRQRQCLKVMILFLVTSVLTTTSQAHMMVAQHGTLNKVDKGIFMVLSLPVSAFVGIDDDHDGQLSNAEFAQHRADIAKQIAQHVSLFEDADKTPLQGMMLSPVNAHHQSRSTSTQLLVMGKFPVKPESDMLSFQVTLFGRHKSEQILTISAEDKSTHRQHSFELTAFSSRQVLFP